MMQNMKHSLRDLVTLRGAKNGFHIEHVLSYNGENLKAFSGDEERFETERNRLGAVLLLKGKDNISSGNETYRMKVSSYASTLLWNETLRHDTYKSKLDLKHFVETTGLLLRALDQFGPDEVEERQKLLFEISARIWPLPSATPA
jgi:hypothetical protein